MYVDHHWRNGTKVAVLHRGKRGGTVDFDKAGTGGELAFHQLKMRQIREARGMTQEQVAWRAGMSVSGFRKVETGLRGNVRLATLERIAWVLGVQVRDLL